MLGMVKEESICPSVHACVCLLTPLTGRHHASHALDEETKAASKQQRRSNIIIKQLLPIVLEQQQLEHSGKPVKQETDKNNKKTKRPTDRSTNQPSKNQTSVCTRWVEGRVQACIHATTDETALLQKIGVDNTDLQDLVGLGREYQFGAPEGGGF